MRKVLFSILLLFFYSQIFAQNISAKERIATAPDNKSLNAPFKSASVLKVNIFAPLLGYSQFSLEKSIGHLRNIEFGVGIIGAGRDLNIQPHSLGLALIVLVPISTDLAVKINSVAFLSLGINL